MIEDNTNERAVKPEDGKKPPKPRRTGQRKTIVAWKKYILCVFLGRDAAGKRHYHSETFTGPPARPRTAYARSFGVIAPAR
jgi:hypothetical protein